MQDNYFDQLIRAKLQSYEVPEGPSDWEALAERLDADFDAALAEKLAAATLAYDPADWEMMEEKLEQPLDAIIREKLEAHEVPFVPADWEAMEAAMPHPFDMAIQAKLSDLSFATFDANWEALGAQLDADFDAHVRTQMDQIHPAPVPGDWEAMAQLLDAGKAAVWYQRLAPVMDAVILLLLAMLWWGGNGAPQADMTAAVEPQKQPTPLKAEVVAPVDGSEDSFAETLSVTGQIQSYTEGTPTSSPTESSRLQESSDVQHTDETEGNAMGRARLETSNAEKATATGVYGGPAKPTYSLTTPAKVTGLTHISPPSVHFSIEAEEKRNVLPGLRIGASASFFSSAAEFNDPGLQGQLLGFRVELPISEKISLISGLLVGEKHFDRMKLNVAFDNSMLNRQPTYWMSRLKGNIQLLEIPVFMRYSFSSDKKINLYFQGGFSPVITLNEEYLHYDPRSAGNLSQTQARSDIDFTQGKDNPALEAYLNSLQPNVDVHRLNTYAGFLNLAPGVEIQLASQLALQVEPYIQFGLQRIGSERQSIHSMGGTFSLMYRFSNR